MAAFNDFAVDPCIAKQIKACEELKKCLIENQLLKTLNKLETQFGGSSPIVSGNVALRAKLNETYQCLIDAITDAYVEAGETLPPIPPVPTDIDFGSAAAAVQPLSADIKADPMAFLESVMIIEKDGDGLPTFIRCPPAP
jgi:hypothetical protein